MMDIHWRLAELWLLQQKRRLTEAEASELNACMTLNAKYAQRVAEQYNYGIMASMTKDWSWLHEISSELDKLESLYVSKRPSFFEI
ncbi:hypothetical protein BK133_18875 [Paenibacillus sp. FSL H8-0548]|uniref:DUF7667 family protein n=1 Tax=Paenibacillus sp. FSL H8-0548 TaxID=1920422 RepID=UPI00096CCBA7|nr:hypothetical protein [Paenibacillus sp. FSL H8-0548]OMF28081.1 hypothetical protein BK133_18875 [Paenibacillus sp. FSL H8-0548]